jgi:predicted RNA binding protein YcfA (HicA-like mRNA interferase family)
LTPVHWKKFEKFVLYVGCHFERQKGDHRIYWRSGLKRPVVFPADKEVPVFIIRNNLRTLGISVREYLEIIEKL